MAQLLTEMLKTIDRLNVFEQSGGVSPFLLLDGHGGHFDLTFLEYINDSNGNNTKEMFA